MQEKSAKVASAAPTNFINAQSAITGLRGRDLFSTLRNVAAQGLRHPFRSAR
ncbi:poly(R)-hydroxyalkanoic acid synthase, class II, partial [Pseudomonas amygdali pv. mori str. 301020]